MKVEVFEVDEIFVGKRLREPDQKTVQTLAASMLELGLRTPITVRIMNDFPDKDGRISDGVAVLVSGLHRLEAAKLLGWEKIDGFIADANDADARLWEIAENLHRADLSVQERSDQLADWIRITEEKAAQGGEKLVQLAPVSGRGGRGKQGGIRAAERELGIEHTDAIRSLKIASIAPEAKAAAAEAGVKSQTGLLEVAKEPTPERQVAKAREIGERRTKPAPAIKNALESEEDWRRSLFTVWNRGAQDWRERAMETMDAPVFDASAAAAGLPARH